MGNFGSGVYFEGPIETKSMILTPEPPALLPGQKASSSGRSSYGGSGSDKVVKGLPGESYYLQSQINAVAGEERALRNKMYDEYVASNGKADLTKHNKEISQLMDRKTQLQTQVSQAEKRQATWQETNTKLKGKGGQYYADPSGNYRTYEELGLDVIAEDDAGGKVYGNDAGVKIYSTDNIVKVGDIISIAEQSYAVPEEFLNYRHVDMDKLHKDIADVFKETKGHNTYGEEAKMIAYQAVLSGKDPLKVAASLGFTGKDNLAALEQASQDLAGRINTNDEMKRAVQYGFNNYLKTADTKGKSVDQLYSSYLNDLISGKKAKQRQIDRHVDLSAREALLRTGENINKQKETLRYKLAFGHDDQALGMFDDVSKYMPGTLTTTMVNLHADEMRSSFEKGLDSEFYKERISGNPKAEKKYKEALAFYKQSIAEGGNKEDAWKTISKYVPEIMSGVNATPEEKKMALKDQDKNSGQEVNPVYWNKRFIKNDNFQIAPLNDELIKDEFSVLAPGNPLPDKANLMIGANDAKEVEQYQGLENSMIVSVDSYARGIDINGQNKNAIAVTLFVPNEDANAFGKNMQNLIYIDDDGNVKEGEFDLNQIYDDDLATWESLGIQGTDPFGWSAGDAFDNNVGEYKFEYPENNTGGLTGEQEGFTIKVLIEDKYFGIDAQRFEDTKNRGTKVHPSEDDQGIGNNRSSNWFTTKNRE